MFTRSRRADHRSKHLHSAGENAGVTLSPQSCQHTAQPLVHTQIPESLGYSLEARV